jgi:hypothetical protein
MAEGLWRKALRWTVASKPRGIRLSQVDVKRQKKRKKRRKRTSKKAKKAEGGFRYATLRYAFLTFVCCESRGHCNQK